MTPGTWVVVKTIDEGFRGLSPAGYYTVQPSVPIDIPLKGTVANWDGYRDDTESSTRPPAERGNYRIRMYVDSLEASGCPKYLTVV